MKKQGRFPFFSAQQFNFLGLVFSASLLSGCVGGIWTGVNIVYNRHHVYKKFDDYKLAAKANYLLFNDKILKERPCYLDLAVFNGDILLAGHVPASELREKAKQRLKDLNGYRKLYFQVAIDKTKNNELTDIWITTKIRSRIVSDSEIDPAVFKIITSDNIVYVMGDVQSKQAARVLDIAKNTEGVYRVVNLLKLYSLTYSK